MSLPPDPTAAEIVETTVPLRGSAAAACALCADRLLDGVRGLPGVARARVDAPSATLRVALDPAVISPSIVSNEAEKIAATLARSFGHRTYRVGGMDCADCARSIEKSVGALPGVLSASVNFAAARMRVEYAPGTTGVEQVAARAHALGFTAVDAAAPETPGTPAGTRRGLSDPVRVGASGALLVLGLLLEHGFDAPRGAADVLLGASVLVGGYRFALAGLRALQARTVGTNLLMALAAAGAIALGHWEEAAAVVFLYALGEALEGAAMERTRRSLRSLIDATPPQALVQRADLREEIIAADELIAGDVMIVKPGARVAADGVVVSGQSAVSEAAITGESLPRDKKRGDAVYAGSVNGNGALLARVTAPAADSTLARILHLVEEAQAQKAPAQALVERFGRIYTPLVIVAALALAGIGSLVAPGGNWVYRSLTLLVVACPCALVIATPVAFVSGIARAARGGVLVKGGAFLEALAAARHVALDKTGTLTTGRPAVTDIVAASGDETDLLALAAAVERHSEHPIAAAVVAHAAQRGLAIPLAANAHAVPGRGIAATQDDNTVLVGSPAFLRERSVAIPASLQASADAWASDGKTVLLVTRAGQAIGALAVADAPRPDAAEAVAALGRLGLTTTMLTGDGAAVARSVGRSVGVTDVHAELLPEDKLARVRELDARPGGVVFAGDGINDAPALAAARVGIAMGAGGTAAALEAADIALMGDDLLSLPWAIRLARATRGVVRQNVVLSLGVVVLLLATTVTGWLSLPLGVLGHEGSALLVVLNGLRLLSPRLTRL